jgi:hypothetical protein
MQIPDGIAARIMDAAQLFQTKLTRMAAKLAEDDKRTEMTPDDVRISLVLMLSKDALDTWSCVSGCLCKKNGGSCTPERTCTRCGCIKQNDFI